MLLARGAGSLTLWEQACGLSEPTDDDREVYVVHSLRENTYLQLRNHEEIKTNDEERLEDVWRNDVKTFKAYVAIKEEFIQTLSDFETM